MFICFLISRVFIHSSSIFHQIKLVLFIFFVASRIFSSHIVISSRCHLISLSFHLVVILHHFRKMNSSNFVLVNVSDKKTTDSRISIKMIQVKATLVKAALIKRISVKRDKRISIKKASNRIIIEVRKIAEKIIILSAEDEKITNF